MNSCEHYQELISRLVDGDLSREEHEALMEHMKSCSACNAMYAVFHDLSDILAEESEPLPEGLHENIMAGVRRSEIMKKNRRMRKFGLSTALTAAACAVLVLFAAAGITPGQRAESVSIRTEEEAIQQLPASPAPVLYTAEPQPAVTPAPASFPTPMPAQTQAPASTAGSDTGAAYLPPQQSYFYTEQPAPVYTSAPAVIQSTPMPVQTVVPAPAVITPIPAQTAAPDYARLSDPVPPPAAVVSEPVLTQDVNTALAAAASDSAAAQPEAPAAPAAAGEEAAPAEESAVESAAPAEESGILSFSLFGDVASLFSAAPDALGESKLADPDGATLFAAETTALGEEDDMQRLPDAQDAPVLFMQEAPALFSALAAPADAENAGDALDGAQEQAETKAPAEESLTIYDKTLRAKLLAMLGSSEDTLPEAELTRLVHVTLAPGDAYGSEEKLDIRIYGDFVFYTHTSADGVSKTCRASCALRDLDSFLLSCRTAAPTPTPAPTVDPFIAVETPQPEPAAS